MSSRRSFLKQFSGLVAVSAAASKVSEVEHPQISDELREELEGSTYTPPPTYEPRIAFMDLVEFHANGARFLARVESMEFQEIVQGRSRRSQFGPFRPGPGSSVEVDVVIPQRPRGVLQRELFKGAGPAGVEFFRVMELYDLAWERHGLRFALEGTELVEMKLDFNVSELRLRFRGLADGMERNE